jgi:hypothetical protein
VPLSSLYYLDVNGLLLFFVVPANVAKESKSVLLSRVTVACHCRWRYRVKFRQCKHSLTGECLEVAWAKFETLGSAVLLQSSKSS